MLTSIRPDTFRQILLGAGILFTRLDHHGITTCAALRERMQAAMDQPGALLGTTKGPAEIHIKPMYHQLSINDLRTPTAGALRVDGWTVRVTGTLAEVSPRTLAALLPFAQVSQGEQCSRLSLSHQPAGASAIPCLTWVGDLGMGLMVVDIPQAVNTLGVELKLNPQGEGTIPFSFLGQLTLQEDGAAAPCAIHFFQEDRDHTP